VNKPSSGKGSLQFSRYQFPNHIRIKQRAGVAQIAGFSFGDFPQNAAHDLSASRLG
jgi:hypothetical protein